MCLGGGGGGGSAPKPPKIKYKGPSQEDVRRQEESLERYESQIQQQQRDFQSQLQAQIDAANRETASLRSRYADDLSAAEKASNRAIGSAQASGKASIDDAMGQGMADTAAANAEALTQQIGALTVTSQESEPEQAQTTEPIKKIKKPKKNLKISTAGAASGAGSGLNIGV